MIAYQLGATLARLNASTPSTGTSTPRVRVRDD
jgi:hypothetical protein